MPPLTALGIQTQQPDVGKQIETALAIKGALQQQAMQQRAMQDQQTTMQVLSQTGGDMDKALPILAGKVSPNTYISLRKADIESKTAAANLTQKQREIMNDQLDRLNVLGEQLKQLTPQQYAAAWPNAVAMAQQIAPDSPFVKQLDPNNPAPQESIPQLQLGLATSKNYISLNQETRAAKKAPFEQQTAEATARKVGAEADKTQAEAQAIKNYQGQGIVPGVPLENQEAADWLRKNPGKTLADYQRYKSTLVPAFNFNLQAHGVGAGSQMTPTDAKGQPLTGQALYKSFGPKGGVVKAIIEGRQEPPKSFAQKSPYWQDVMAKVYQVDPQFNEQRAQLRKDFTLGKGAAQINAINTTLGHMGELNDAIDALNNGDIQQLNRLANSLGAQVGQTPQTTFKTIVHRVGPEITAAYVQGGGGEHERGANAEDFSPNLSPQQLKSNVAISAQLLRSKIGALENQWEQNRAPSMPSFQEQFITPAARKTIDRLAPQGGAASSGSVTMRAPNGQTRQVTADQVEHYKSLGATIVNQ